MDTTILLWLGLAVAYAYEVWDLGRDWTKPRRRRFVSEAREKSVRLPDVLRPGLRRT